LTGAVVRPIGLTTAPVKAPSRQTTPNGWIAKAPPLLGVHGGKAPWRVQSLPLRRRGAEPRPCSFARLPSCPRSQLAAQPKCVPRRRICGHRREPIDAIGLTPWQIFSKGSQPFLLPTGQRARRSTATGRAGPHSQPPSRLQTVLALLANFHRHPSHGAGRSPEDYTAASGAMRVRRVADDDGDSGCN
jgi:hypothetical protein